ncbi:hypothetical protein CHUAL_007692 [Chamberlinius hualienensis]
MKNVLDGVSVWLDHVQNLKMYAMKLRKIVMDKSVKLNQQGLLFVAVFLVGVSFSLVIQLLPEILRLVPTQNNVDRSNSVSKYSVQKGNGFGAGLPWKEQLQVGEDPGFEIPGNDDDLFARKRRQETEAKSHKISLQAEALASLRLALEMRNEGKEDKAMKLFRQAFALDPTHPDVLNHYGEFLEHKNDVILAEHLYSRVLRLSPDHSKALMNRQRTLPMVEELDEEYLNVIDEKRDQLLTISSSDPSLRRISKEAYFQHIYHTVGLEGNTMTLSETRSIVETHLAVGGKSILEHNEILGLEAALIYINTTLLHKLGTLTLNDVLEVHKRVMGFVDPINAGCLRSTNVFVGNHVPPPPDELLDLLTEFIEWMNSEEALSLHPVRLSALVHYKFVHIHPFIDGNGRTSRLLMNLVLMTTGYPPVIIRKQDRLQYYQHLQTANEGDVRPFIRFIAQCTEKTLDAYLYVRHDFAVPALENQRHNSQKIILNN